LSNPLLTCNTRPSQISKQNKHLIEKNGKLESLKNIYFHKLNFYLNQTTTNQVFIIHLLHHIIINTSHSCDTINLYDLV